MKSWNWLIRNLEAIDVIRWEIEWAYPSDEVNHIEPSAAAYGHHAWRSILRGVEREGHRIFGARCSNVFADSWFRNSPAKVAVRNRGHLLTEWCRADTILEPGDR